MLLVSRQEHDEFSNMFHAELKRMNILQLINAAFFPVTHIKKTCQLDCLFVCKYRNTENL